MLLAPNTTYVIMQDLRPDAMKQYLADEEETPIPKGYDSDLDRLGKFSLLNLNACTNLEGRLLPSPSRRLYIQQDQNGGQKVVDDVIQVWVTGR